MIQVGNKTILSMEFKSHNQNPWFKPMAKLFYQWNSNLILKAHDKLFIKAHYYMVPLKPNFNWQHQKLIAT